jgi:hypothetical protein
MVWSIITWQTSTMVPTVSWDTGPHLWHRCLTRHLKVQSVEDTCEVTCAAQNDGEFERQPSLPGLLQDSDWGQSERAFCSCVTTTHSYLLLFSFPPSMLRLFNVGRIDVLFFWKNRCVIEKIWKFHPNVEVCPFHLKNEIDLINEMDIRISFTFHLKFIWFW